MTEEETAWARAYIESQTWTYAKTVPEAQHWYLMQPRQDSPDRPGYEQMAAIIRRHGDIRPWTIPGTDRVVRYRYLTLEDYDYWCTTRPGLWTINRRAHLEPEAPLLPLQHE